MPEGPAPGLFTHRFLAEAALRRVPRSPHPKSGDGGPHPGAGGYAGFGTEDGHGRAEPEADIRSAPWWRVRTLRRTAAREAVSVGGLLGLALVTAGALPWWIDAAALSGGPTARTQAVVRGTHGVVVPVLLPDNLLVEFRTADGRKVRTRVPYRGAAPAPGERLPVEYAVGAPAHAAAASGYGLLWGVADSVVLAGLCLARIGWCAFRSGRTIRMLVAAARCPEAHPVRYVQLHDSDDGTAWLLFFPVPGTGDDPPSLMLPVRAAVGEPAGLADLRGEVRDGGVAVPWIAGRAVWPDGSLSGAGPEDEDFLLHLAAGIADLGGLDGRGRPPV